MDQLHDDYTWFGRGGDDNLDFNSMDLMDSGGTSGLTDEHSGLLTIDPGRFLGFLLETGQLSEGFNTVFDASPQPDPIWGSSPGYEAYTPTSASPNATQTSSPWDLSVSSPTNSGVAHVSPSMWESPPAVTKSLPLDTFQPPWPTGVNEGITFQVPDCVSTELVPAQPSIQTVTELPAPEPNQNHQSHSRSAGHPRLKAKERRKIKLPEECPVCRKGHQYQALLNRHIRVHHPDILARQVFPCPEKGCNRSYTRSDRLYRHGVEKHRWVSKKNNKRR